MRRSTFVALTTALLVLIVGRAQADCPDVAACRREANGVMRTLDASGPHRGGASELLRRLDAALARGCGLGDSDACRTRIQFHVARESVQVPGTVRVWNRTLRRYEALRADATSSIPSSAAIHESFDRLRTLERARVEAEDSAAAYSGFIAEFPADPSEPRYRARYAELGLAQAVERSRAESDLNPLFVFCEQARENAITEPVLFAEVLHRGTLADVDRYLRSVADATGTPADHVRQMNDRRRGLRFDEAEARSRVEGVAPLIAILRDYPTAVEAVRALDGLRPMLSTADPVATYEALLALHPMVAPSVRARVVDALSELFLRQAPSERMTRALPLLRMANADGRRGIVAAVSADARAAGNVSLLFDLVAASPGDAAAETALFDSVMERGSTQEIQRYLEAFATAARVPVDHLERARMRLRDSAFEQAIARADRDGIGPMLDAIIADPRHAQVPSVADAIIRLLPHESATRAFDRLAPSLPQTPAHVRERLADAAVELLVRMGARDRIARFAMAADQASYAQRQRLAEIVRAEISFEPGVAGVSLLRQFARAFPGTQAAREAQRDADAREAAERSRQARDELRMRASRFRR